MYTHFGKQQNHFKFYESLYGYCAGMLTVMRAERIHHLHFLIILCLCCLFIPWHSFGACGQEITTFPFILKLEICILFSSFF